MPDAIPIGNYLYFNFINKRVTICKEIDIKCECLPSRTKTNNLDISNWLIFSILNYNHEYIQEDIGGAILVCGWNITPTVSYVNS